jgi:hypothetical protein
MTSKGLFVYAELDYRIHFEALGVSATLSCKAPPDNANRHLSYFNMSMKSAFGWKQIFLCPFGPIFWQKKYRRYGGDIYGTDKCK